MTSLDTLASNQREIVQALQKTLLAQSGNVGVVRDVSTSLALAIDKLHSLEHTARTKADAA